MDFADLNHSQPRLIGDYILGPKIGAGSFAVVWRSTHRHSGMEVAVKEIEKKHLNAKVSENLLKEITILSTINHPNIIRLFEAIQTKERLYLILEYCAAGDLGAYLNRHGKVSEAVARHFMRQLAAGLKVLQEKHLIHRDLKPQNLLLSTNGENSMLKIGDFGFARSLTPQGLADTLCGSPLYMAPEIIRNEKYDSKADLWSVGAILFQLVTGKPPFDGNNQMQLFQNILTSTVLQFPEGALAELHPDCVDLCRSLLRQNPIERMTFTEFFNHPFLMDPRPSKAVKSSSLHSMKSAVNEIATGSSSGKSQFYLEHPMESSSTSTPLADSPVFGRVGMQEREDYISSSKSVRGLRQELSSDRLGKLNPLDPRSILSSQIQVSDSMESIEKDYVLVNANFASMETFSSSLETSLQDLTLGRLSTCPLERNEHPTAPMKELISSSVDVAESSRSQRSDQQSTSCASFVLREVQGLSISHPSTRLHLLHQYGQVLLELSQEKCNAGLFLESFSVELVILALWKKALQVCSSWMDSTPEYESSTSSLIIDSTERLRDTGSTSNMEENIDFSMPSSVSTWAKRGFFVAIDRAEKLSSHIQNADGSAEMPDAMEIIFQKALEVGRSAAVDEYMGNKSKAAALYSKAILLLSFIVGEAPSLLLNPAFSLTPANRKRIQHYILNLQTRQTNLLMPLPSLKVNPDSR